MTPLFLAASAPIGGPELIMIAIVLATLAFWVWMMIDCATNENSNGKIVWLLVVILGGIFGAAIYFFARKLSRRRIS